MLEAVVTATGAKRIHLGLDETFGQGKYRARRCHRVTAHECEHPPAPSVIFQAHVRKLLALCDTLDVRPMMYSDMLFDLMPEPHAALIQADATVRCLGVQASPVAVLTGTTVETRLGSPFGV
jgi:hypothetical protein